MTGESGSTGVTLAAVTAAAADAMPSDGAGLPAGLVRGLVATIRRV
jgi:hypothetical protein